MNRQNRGRKRGADVAFLVCLLLFFFGTAVDLATKAWAEFYFSDAYLGNPDIRFIPNFMDLTLTYNKGAAWGMMSDNRILMTVITALTPVVIGVFLWIAYRLPKHYNVCRALIGVVASGALGNFIDRVFCEQGVRDFMNVDYIGFGVCNFADYFLSIGGVVFGLCFIVCILTDKEEKKAER